MADLRAEARRVAREHGISERVFEALVNQESGFNVHARSPAGAAGLTQLMPGTARGLGVTNPMDPHQSLEGGAKYLAAQLKAFKGDYRKALAAYNAGPGAVQKYGGVPPYAETQNYVRNIMSRAGNPGKATHASTGGGSRGSSGGSSDLGTEPTTQTIKIPGVDNSALRQTLKQQYLLNDHDPNALLSLAVGLRGAKDTPATSQKITIPGTPGAAPTSRGGSTGGSTASASKGVAKITGPNPGRVIPAVKDFMRQISAVRGGKPVVGSDGTGHSYLTVNGNVSEHSTGHASDIPAAGQELINLGQAALIAAGMPREQARKQQGGLYNVMKGGRRYQIIFNTHEGGDHTDHLHVGVKGG